MKTLPTLLLCLLFCLSTSGRAQTRPITVEPRWFGPVFRYDNLVVQGINFRNALQEDSEALTVLSGSGGLEIVAAVSAGVGTLFLLEGLLADYDNPVEETIFNDSTPAILVGLGTIGGGLLLQGVVNRKRKRAVTIYNRNLGYDVPQGNLAPPVQIVPASSGLGLGMRF